MKTTVTLLILIATLGSSFAQAERPDETDKAANAIVRISKSAQPAEWFMSDGWVFNDVKVISIDGPWVEIEYSYSTRPQSSPVVVPPRAPSGSPETGKQKRGWVSVNHVIRIIPTERVTKESR